MIKKEMQYNMETTTLENDKLIVRILPEIGNTITSIYHKEKEFEFVFQPTDKKFTSVGYGSDFSTGMRSGIIDCIPSIDPCQYKDTGIQMVDHGDVWALKWEEEINETRQTGKIKLNSLPLELTRKIELNDNIIKINYEVENLDTTDHQYLWAFHGLNNFDKDTILEFPESLKNYVNVQNDETWEDITKLGNLKKDWTYKYYFTDEIKEGWTSLIYPNQKLKYTIKFDPKENPYLGVWVTTGGYMNEINIGVEPSNGYYDSLQKAIDNKKVKNIGPREIDKWTIELVIDEI